MTPEDALSILNQATQPQVVGQVTREGYVKIAEALAVLGEVVKQAQAGQTGLDGPKTGP